MSAPTNYTKWMISLLSGLVFLVIASPVMYNLVAQVLGKVTSFSILKGPGCPNLYGLVLHAIVFVLITRALMM